jgi:hypothetical protein
MVPQANEGFEAIVTQFDSDIRELSRLARDLIYEVLPQVVEVPWVQQKVIGYGTGPKKMSEHFAYIAPQKKHVNLGFYYGAELPDPDGLLEGTGKLLRHVKIRSKEDLQKPAVRALLQQSTQHRVPPPKEI